VPTSTVPVDEVGEPPDVAQPHDVPQAREHELQLAAPVAALLVLRPAVDAVGARDRHQVRHVPARHLRACLRRNLQSGRFVVHVNREVSYNF